MSKVKLNSAEEIILLKERQAYVRKEYDTGNRIGKIVEPPEMSEADQKMVARLKNNPTSKLQAA